ncbi:MAG: CPBP family intramembrane metalloprotease [Anaerolineae bacterium]|jgi:membrane protease YdiL (CAAX protease family)|nr:CPBP family intramembrane metalloprotease [Anaerolineae bacterium]
MTQQILFAALLAVLMVGLGAATAQSGRILRRFTPPVNLLLSLPDNLLRLFLIALCFGLGIFLGPGADALGWSLDHFLRDASLGVLVGLLLAPVLQLATTAAVRRWGDEVYDNLVLRAIVPVNRGEWLGVAVALLPAALLEELVFRSLPLAGLTWLISPWVLMWPLALVFGLLHWTQGPLGVVGTTFLGLFLSALFLWTGSLWTVVFAHWALNLVQVTFAWQQGLRPLRAE